MRPSTRLLIIRVLTDRKILTGKYLPENTYRKKLTGKKAFSRIMPHENASFLLLTILFSFCPLPDTDDQLVFLTFFE